MRLKRYSPLGCDFVLVPQMAASADIDSPFHRRHLAELMFGDRTPFVFGIRAIFYSAVLIAPFFNLFAGLTALMMVHLQPLLMTAGTGFRPRDLWLHVFLRTPRELVGLGRMMVSPLTEPPIDLTEKRRFYSQLMAHGPANLLEPRRKDCPICGSTNSGLDSPPAISCSASPAGSSSRSAKIVVTCSRTRA